MGSRPLPPSASCHSSASSSSYYLLKGKPSQIVKEPELYRVEKSQLDKILQSTGKVLDDASKNAACVRSAASPESTVVELPFDDEVVWYLAELCRHGDAFCRPAVLVALLGAMLDLKGREGFYAMLKAWWQDDFGELRDSCLLHLGRAVAMRRRDDGELSDSEQLAVQLAAKDLGIQISTPTETSPPNRAIAIIEQKSTSSLLDRTIDFLEPMGKVAYMAELTGDLVIKVLIRPRAGSLLLTKVVPGLQIASVVLNVALNICVACKEFRDKNDRGSKKALPSTSTKETK